MTACRWLGRAAPRRAARALRLCHHPTNAGRSNAASRQRPTRWQPRQHSLSLEDIEIIVPAIKQHVGGKVVQKDYDKVNVWLRRRARTDSRASVALRALAAPNSLGDECAALMREDLLRARQHDTLPHVGHDKVSDTFSYRRVPMGGSLSTAEVPERNKEQPDRAGRIKELFSLWAPW